MTENGPWRSDDAGLQQLRERSRPDPPRFCPGCSKPRASHSGLCPECGDRLESQGYCTVCEAFWPLVEGEPCPKHELPLVADRPEPPLTVGDGDRIDWVTVGSYPLPFQAEAARLRLDAEGLPTLLDGYRMGTNTAYHVAIGGIRLQVPRAFSQDARILLSQSWSVPADEEEDEEEPDWDEVAPVREEGGDWRFSTVFWAVVLATLIGLAALIALVGG
ncbi:hypothetical protein [Tautonia sociabilis]|uniref:DUF2007 domain-containing protein n=1 Tax=Tautonia sociabilis TaxID=2080755 RepID=A0A432MHW9_9BACT|nr:hypothetical protein [Tautonia sociabilis]RUL86734.1 hypothetical protein TsocGM_15630 [Tautonia sociabilis]